jgi:hypothetical protein
MSRNELLEGQLISNDRPTICLSTPFPRNNQCEGGQNRFVSDEHCAHSADTRPRQQKLKGPWNLWLTIFWILKVVSYLQHRRGPSN